MKKQKGKNQKAGVSKKKDDTPETKDEATSTAEQGGDISEKPQPPYTDGASDEQSAESKDEVVAENQSNDDSETPAQPIHNRQPSLSLQSKMRSSSFRRTSVSQGPLSPVVNGAKSPDIPMLMPDGESVNSIYRKQAARLDELEKENKRLLKDAYEVEKKWKHTEEELEDLREASGEVAELKSRAQKADAQVAELSKLVCWHTTISVGSQQVLTTLIETRKHISSAPELPTPISILQATCLLAQSGDHFLQPPIVSPSPARLQKLDN